MYYILKKEKRIFLQGYSNGFFLTLKIIFLYFFILFKYILQCFKPFNLQKNYVQCTQHNICGIWLQYVYIPLFQKFLFKKNIARHKKNIIHECIMKCHNKFRNNFIIHNALETFSLSSTGICLSVGGYSKEENLQICVVWQLNIFIC